MPQKRLSKTPNTEVRSDRVGLRISLVASIAALSALSLSTAGAASAAQPFGKDGVIHACIKAKGKNKGALRVVPTASGCKRLRGWRPVAWSANASSGSSGQNGSQGTAGSSGAQGPVGPEGKEGPRGVAGQVEKSLLETVKTQSIELGDLTDQVTDLTDEVVNLEGTVVDTCSQLTTLTDQTDEIVTGVNGLELNNALKLLGALITFPDLPATLGTFECQ